MWTPKRIILLAGGFVAFTLVYVVYTLTALGRINTLPPLPDQYKPSASKDSPSVVIRPKAITQTLLERKLEMAFHPGCEELTWPVRLELNSRSMVLAAWKFELADRGRIKLELMSLALFGKKKNDGREIEINTLKCKQAYITFDQPITSLSPGAMKDRKVVAAELFGDTVRPIRITNNRRTAAREDDLEVTITNGPLDYIEKTQIVKTSDYVHLIDGMSTDKDGQLIDPKAVIDAKGMEMELATTAPPPRPFSPPKAKNETISGVKRIVLKEAVKMILRVAGGAPFPGKEKTNAAAPQAKSPVKTAKHGRDPAHPPASEPDLVVIVTPGRFEYEIFKDHDMARFDVPVSSNLPNSPQDVTVTRINEQTGNNDILVCKHLELRLKRRSNDVPTARDTASSEQGLEIETAHATGPDVTLTSDAEKLDAHGNDFFHDTAKKTTTLKGSPYMEATKEDSLIQAPELRIQDVPLAASGGGSPSAAGGRGKDSAAKTYQKIEASGPGSIHMTNKTTGKQSVHAYWNERLLSTKDGQLDLLVLTGAAQFVDDEHGQSLKAETLNVWLFADDKKPQAAAAAAAPTSSRRPHHVEALRNVLAHSPELNIHDAARLVINFKDVPPERLPPPSNPNTKLTVGPVKTEPRPLGSSGNNRPTTVATPNPPEARPSGNGNANHPRSVAAPKESEPQPSGSGNANLPQPVAARNSPTEPPPPRPIDLRAHSIEAKVLRSNERMVLDHIWAEGGALDAVDKRGGVEVRQEPAKPGEEGVYIEGNTLNMNCFAGGNVLIVTGDVAKLRMDKIWIYGPEVNIDQVNNKAWVVGGGAMQMQSTTTLEGKPLARPVPLTVHWDENMFFQGTFAFFQGNIQAQQDSARLACQALQVIFDRPISLKEGMRGTQPAKVSKLVADKGKGEEPVRIEEQTYEGVRLQKYQLLIGTGMQMVTVERDDETLSSSPPKKGDKEENKSNDANEVTLYGPGSVRILQRGGGELMVTPSNPVPNQAAPAPTTAKDQEMKLTYVTFMRVMKASSRKNVANFWESVRVLNMPCDDPHLNIDLDDMLSRELPEGALYLRCNRLRVGTYQKAVGGGTTPKQLRTYQVMDAVGQVYVQGKDFTAQCDRMSFNEEKDQVIFEAEGGNYAVMTKGDASGGERKSTQAKKFTYIRSTGAVRGEEIRSFGN